VSELRRLLFAGAMLYGLIALLAYASQGSGFKSADFGETRVIKEETHPLLPLSLKNGKVGWNKSAITLAILEPGFYKSEASGESSWTIVGRGARSTLGLSLLALIAAASLSLLSSLTGRLKQALNQFAFALESLPMVVIGAFLLVGFSGISLIGGWEARWLFVGALLAKYWAGLHVFLISPAETITNAPYIITANSKGLNPLTVVLKHMLPNLSLKLLPVLASGLPSLLSGAIILEEVLFQPGLGSVLVQAVINHELGTLCALLWLAGGLSILALMLPKTFQSLRGAGA